jgi:uncharacterized protein Usg
MATTRNSTRKSTTQGVTAYNVSFTVTPKWYSDVEGAWMDKYHAPHRNPNACVLITDAQGNETITFGQYCVKTAQYNEDGVRKLIAKMQRRAEELGVELQRTVESTPNGKRIRYGYVVRTRTGLWAEEDEVKDVVYGKECAIIISRTSNAPKPSRRTARPKKDAPAFPTTKEEFYAYWEAKLSCPLYCVKSGTSLWTWNADRAKVEDCMYHFRTMCIYNEEFHLAGIKRDLHYEIHRNKWGYPELVYADQKDSITISGIVMSHTK